MIKIKVHKKTTKLSFWTGYTHSAGKFKYQNRFWKGWVEVLLDSFRRAMIDCVSEELVVGIHWDWEIIVNQKKTYRKCGWYCAKGVSICRIERDYVPSKLFVHIDWEVRNELTSWVKRQATMFHSFEFNTESAIVFVQWIPLLRNWLHFLCPECCDGGKQNREFSNSITDFSLSFHLRFAARFVCSVKPTHLIYIFLSVVVKKLYDLGSNLQQKWLPKV